MHFNRVTDTNEKDNKKIQIDEYMDMTKYVRHSNEENDKPIFFYKLYATIEHIGTNPCYGHYIAKVISGDRNYYTFDDNFVYPCNKIDLMSGRETIFMYERIFQ